ncbi:hypothetical protein [Streptomyces sp. NPDC014622]|uniref:hypothetical protein n=1 Tax=Streptomyces sp. NPDC014622 TaxID=3364874 RepID=UPI0036F51C78
MFKFLSLFRKKTTPAAPVVKTLEFRDIADAAKNLETVWSSTYAWHVAPRHLTCNEVEALAELLRVVGLDDIANKVLTGHNYSDDDEDDMHHGEYLELTGAVISV